MTVTRRAILRGAAVAAATGLAPFPGLSRLLFAAGAESERILVVLHLRGGCDGLNLLSPATDKDFIEARNSELRVAAEGVDAGHSILHVQPGAPEFRLHPSAAALAELVQSKHLAFVHASGLIDSTRSHFVATDMIEHGVADAAALNRSASGWLARSLPPEDVGSPSRVRAVSLSVTPSGAWSGNPNTISVADLGNGLAAPGGPAAANVLQALYGAQGGLADIREAGNVTLRAMQLIDARLARDEQGKVVAYKSEGGSNYDPAYELGRPLKTLAQLIKMDVGLRSATVDLGGWDTHEYQQGRFRNQVERLSQGLGAFYNDMASYHDRITVVVITEFGRRLRSNRSNGTDHGRGSLMMALGGTVAGGQVLGNWPGLKSEQLEEGVDLAVANDYRQCLGEALRQWSPAADIAAIFPGFKLGPSLGLFA